jgi:hypothetical protein
MLIIVGMYTLYCFERVQSEGAVVFSVSLSPSPSLSLPVMTFSTNLASKLRLKNLHTNGISVRLPGLFLVTVSLHVVLAL